MYGRKSDDAADFDLGDADGPRGRHRNRHSSLRFQQIEAVTCSGLRHGSLAQSLSITFRVVFECGG